MKKQLLQLLFLVFGLMFFHQSAMAQKFGYVFTGNQKRVTLPFEIVNNLIVIPVKVKGVTLRFILDTGVKNTLLVNRIYSDLLQIKYQRRISLLGVDRNQEMSALVAPNIKMELAGIVNENETLVILEEDYLQFEKIFDADIQGIIGYEFLRPFVVKIDYDRKVLVLYKHGQFKPRRRYKPYDLELNYGKPYLKSQLTFENKDTFLANLLIDTGASFDLLLHVGVDTAITLPSKTLKGDLGRGLGGILDGLIGRVSNLDIMPYNFKEVITYYQDVESFEHLSELKTRHGIVGSGILGRFVVVLDYRNRTMYLKRGRKYKKPFLFNMSGIIIENGNNAGKSFRIKEVLPNTPGAAVDLRTGDEIIRLNGVRGSYLTRIFIKNIFKRRVGKKIRLTIIRDGQKIKKTFRLEKLI